jgi:hypothetical protein
VADAVVAASAPSSTPAFELAPDKTRQIVTDAIRASAGEIGLDHAA